MEIVPIAADDEPALRAWHGVLTAASDVDSPGEPPPTWREIATFLTVPWPGEPATAWLAREGGSAVGSAVLGLPSRDNLGNGVVELMVHPAHRRRGAGRALLAHLTALARFEGRVRLRAESLDPLRTDGPGTAFALAAGARPVLEDVRRRLVVGPAPAPLPVRGYGLVTWSGDTPERWLDERARLTGRMSIDSPQGELDWEPELFDARRVRERDALCRARGWTVTVTAAVAPDGALAAFTELMVRDDDAGWAHQWNTLVDPPHRGHGLGIAVKAANLAAVRGRNPHLHTVQTINAADNPHMVAVNDALGFRPVDRLREWQLDLA